MGTLSSKGTRAARSATARAKNTAANPGLILLGRFGYLAKGLVYVIIGGLAALAASGNGGGATTDRKGALQAIYEQPFGKILLGIVAFGLACYGLWCIIRAAADTERKGSDAKGLASRLFYLGVGLSYALLAFGAVQLVMGKANSGKNSDTNAQDWTAELLKQPFGTVLVIGIGLIVVGVGLYQIYRAYKGEFQKHLKLDQMSASIRKWAVRFGQFGMSARGVVFGVIGIFLIVAALNHDPNQAKGLGGALQELTVQPYGQLLLAIVAVGLIAYGIYCWAEARYRKMVDVSASTTTNKP